MITVLYHNSFYLFKNARQNLKKAQVRGIHNCPWKDDKGFVTQVVKAQPSKLQHFGDTLNRCPLPKLKLPFWHTWIHSGRVRILCQCVLQLLTYVGTWFLSLLRGAVQFWSLWSLMDKIFMAIATVIQVCGPLICCLWQMHKQVKNSLKFSSFKTVPNLWNFKCLFELAVTAKIITSISDLGDSNVISYYV